MNKQKEEIIESIQKALSSEMTFIQERDISIEDKLIVAEVLWNTIKFLDDYDKNINILKRNTERGER